MKRWILGAAGLALVAAFAFFLYGRLDSPAECDVCYRPLHEETFYRIHLTSGESLDLCCPRCGLRFQEGRTDVAAAEVTDFYTRDRLEADEAFYVENSPVHFCSHEPIREDRSGTLYEVAWDRCLPSLLAFESRDAARAFQIEYGGTIKTYEELLEERLK